MTEQPMAERLERGLRFERTFAQPPRAAVARRRRSRRSHRLAGRRGRGGRAWAAPCCCAGRGDRDRHHPPRRPATPAESSPGRSGRTESLVRFELYPAGSGTRLVLTHTGIDALAGFSAGWRAHLDLLEGTLDGREVDWHARWEALVEPGYEEAVASPSRGCGRGRRGGDQPETHTP